jgi:hypothetical protein
VIVLAVRWYLRFGCPRDVEELLAERGIDVNHVTVHRWVLRFAPLLADAARFARHRGVCCIKRSRAILTTNLAVRSRSQGLLAGETRLAAQALGDWRGA